MSRTTGSTRSDRGISDVVGFVLVFSLIVVTIGVISVGGLDTLQSVRDAEQVTNAERAFDVLADNVEDIYRERAPSRGTEIDANDASVSIAADPVVVNVTGVDSSTGSSFVVEREVDPVIYEPTAGGTQLVYVAGAVFRDEGRDDGGVVIEAPPFIVGNDSTMVTVVNTTATGVTNAGGGTILVRTLEEDTTVEVSEYQASYDRLWLNLTVAPGRQDLWLETLAGRPAVDCITPAADEVACEFRQSPDRLYVTSVDIRVTIEG